MTRQKQVAAKKPQATSIASKPAETMSLETTPGNWAPAAKSDLKARASDGQPSQQAQKSYVATSGAQIYKPDAKYIQDLVAGIAADCAAKDCEVCGMRTRLALAQFGESARELAQISCKFCQVCGSQKDLVRAIKGPN